MNSAKPIREKMVIRHFANKWSTCARVDFYLLERQTRACLLIVGERRRDVCRRHLFGRLATDK